VKKIHARQGDQCPETTLRPSGKQDRCWEILIVLYRYIICWITVGHDKNVEILCFIKA